VYDYANLNIWLSVRIIGAVIISVICVRLRDIKIIIAYSSVRHMGLVLIALVIIQPLGGYGGLLLILAHGARSSGIFLISYYIYKVNFSRRILLRKGILV
jgi:NADH:ubiquinone oxidoreductase subunit 4 (subunit M)